MTGLPHKSSTPTHSMAHWDSTAQDLFSLAGNIAARRRREQLGVKRGTFVHDVKITLADFREAYALTVLDGGWQGGPTPALWDRLTAVEPREFKGKPYVSYHDLGKAAMRRRGNGAAEGRGKSSHRKRDRGLGDHG